ncbi:hypothetical protein [Hydrogenophaga sp. Root209]|uniref:hypothetical protein n=1 Tax=Hydrogenophaga sp. Root209 TaxID=1736490 RepID=UPI00138F0EFB|nr:hypothetical protein [Hydrogenophaga sp. Root209]
MLDRSWISLWERHPNKGAFFISVDRSFDIRLRGRYGTAKFIDRGKVGIDTQDRRVALRCSRDSTASHNVYSNLEI